MKASRRPAERPEGRRASADCPVDRITLAEYAVKWRERHVAFLTACAERERLVRLPDPRVRVGPRRAETRNGCRMFFHLWTERTRYQLVCQPIRTEIPGQHERTIEYGLGGRLIGHFLDVQAHGHVQFDTVAC